MAEGEKGTSPKLEPIDVESKEDAETRAARRELKQSSISDAPPPQSGDVTDDEKAGDAAAVARPATPAKGAAGDAENEELKEQVSSPKKKRAHDQLDSGAKSTQDADAASEASTESAKDRTSRSEPEKKRHRDDEPSESKTATSESAAAQSSTTKKSEETTSSSFAASGFSKLATGASPFAALGGAGQPSGFGTSSAPKLSSFAKLPPDTPNHTPTSPAQTASSTTAAAAPPTAAPKLSFGGATGASPFAGLSGTKSNGFGGGFGGGFGSGGSAFGSALSGPKLTGFAAPGTSSIPIGKPAKPFGAPDSDAEDDEDDDGEEGENAATEEAERALSPETDEKKRIKLQKVEVDAGETNEATVLSVRAKMFYHDKEAGWKERGAGMLKINTPASCIEYDDDGVPIAGSFDASGLEEGDEEGADGGNKVVRLLMRQDQTHRVILNTVLVPAMKFQEKASLKSVAVIFTAFEGEDAKPVSVTMRMSAANAKLFMNEIESIQRELSNR